MISESELRKEFGRWVEPVLSDCDVEVRIYFDTSTGLDLISLFCNHVSDCVRDTHNEPIPPTIPLFVTPVPSSRSGRGLSIPSELVLDTLDLKDMPNRIRQLRVVHPNGIGLTLLRAMCVGAFRKHLFLDDDNHGQGEMDTSDLKNLSNAEAADWGRKTRKDGNSWPEVVIEEIQRMMPSQHDTGRTRQAFGMLFWGHLQAIKDTMEKIRCITQEPVQDDSHQELDPKKLASLLLEAYPIHNGSEISLRLPFEKGEILVIDDNSESAKALLERHLSNLYNFTPLNVTSDEIKESRDCMDRCIVRRLMTTGNIHRFDLILLDLSLGEGHGADPLGYQLLPLLRKVFPLIPIVAYTKYRDMSHVQRAFHRGASWFISKDESEKLAAHHLEIIGTPRWKREWLACKDQIKWDLSVGGEFDDAEMHLIWKTVEHMPGGRVLVRELRGGIGGARTLHVSREINGRYDRAAPVVIKIDQKFDMLLERERYQRFIQPYLSNLAGRIDVPLHVGGRNLGAIAYSYAGTNQGRRGGRREVLSLEALLKMNLPDSHQGILDVGRYERLFQRLLEDILRRIHSIDPRPEPSEADFPNLVFGESPSVEERDASKAMRSYLSGSPLDAYMNRMPPERECEMLSMTEGFVDGTIRFAHVYSVDVKSSPHIKAVLPGEDGLLHRVDIRDDRGCLFAAHRHLRPMQPLPLCDTEPSGEGKQGAEVNPRSYFKKEWRKLWESVVSRKAEDGSAKLASLKEGGENMTFFFINSRQDLCEKDPAEAISALVDWLCDRDGRPRRALEQGRIGIVHGDMNLGNVMVERERGGPPDPVNAAPWLIDFARTRRDWIAQDYTQLELDLCMRLVRFCYFPKLKNAVTDRVIGAQDWQCVDEFVTCFLETPWQEPEALKHDARLRFIYFLMRQIRNGADTLGVRDEEYLASRVWQCLITHKILCGKWRKKVEDTEDPDLQFRCVWSLKQAFQTARLLGWNPNS